MRKSNEREVTINGNACKVYRIKNDINGNGRYVVHFTTLGIKLDDFLSRGKKDRRAASVGLKIYRGRGLSCGYMLTSCNLENDLNYMYNMINKED